MPNYARTGAGKVSRTAGKQGGGSKPGGSSGTKGYESGGNFWDFQAKPVAGINPMMRQAAAGVGALGNAGQGDLTSARNLFGDVAGGNQYTSDATSRATNLADQRSPEFLQAISTLNSMGDVSRRQVSGEGLEKDPAFLAAKKAYSNTIGRSTQNAAALAGLGRSSTMQNAQAAGRAQYMTPMIQDYFGRQERGIQRELGALGTQAQGLFGASGQRGADARTAISSLQQAGQQRTQEQLASAGGYQNLAAGDRATAAQKIGMQQGMGTQARGIEQEKLDAPYNEQMRLYSEALNSMYGPMGMIGGLLGGSSTSSQSKK